MPRKNISTGSGTTPHRPIGHSQPYFSSGNKQPFKGPVILSIGSLRAPNLLSGYSLDHNVDRNPCMTLHEIIQNCKGNQQKS
jgi:hypothetical protein